MLLAELLKKHGSMIWSFHDHDSLLENQVINIDLFGKVDLAKIGDYPLPRTTVD